MSQKPRITSFEFEGWNFAERWQEECQRRMWALTILSLDIQASDYFRQWACLFILFGTLTLNNFPFSVILVDFFLPFTCSVRDILFPFSNSPTPYPANLDTLLWYENSRFLWELNEQWLEYSKHSTKNYF